MKTLKLLEELRKYPLFTMNDLSRILRKSSDYVKVVVYRLQREGLVKRVEKGKYTVHDDPVEFASYITVPSYISFWTALRIYNLTEQLPADVMVAVPKPKKEISFGSARIGFTVTKNFWGYGKKRYRDFDIFIAEKEKAVIDCAMAKNTPFVEVAKAVLGRGLDYEKLVEYTIKTKNRSLAKRIGYLMEMAGKNAGKLLPMVDNNYTALDWSSKAKGRKDPRWKIIANVKSDGL